MDQRQAFLLSMLEDDSDASRLAFSDWLSEQGEEDAARRFRAARGPVGSAWAVIEDWLARNHPTMLGLLKGPADEPDFWAVEALIKQKLPDDFKASYRIHDGSADCSGPLIGLSLMSLAEVGDVWGQWADYADDAELVAELSDDITSSPRGAVKPLYANRAWIPFAGDSMNHVALDYDPGPKGVAGQVINCGRDDSARHAIAPTFTAFLAFVARQFVHGRVVVNEDDEDTDEPQWLKVAGTKHDLLTGLPELLRADRKKGRK
jgi:uncharacterized protein (TIGR02996 family)